jgi:hypothetical protein
MRIKKREVIVMPSSSKYRKVSPGCWRYTGRTQYPAWNNNHRQYIHICKRERAGISFASL